MSTMHGPIEPMSAPAGAVPQPPSRPGGIAEAGDTLGSVARSGDTDVVFRLARDVPLVHRLRELASDGLERLLDSWRMVVAGALGLLALGSLAAVVGGAYGHRPPP